MLKNAERRAFDARFSALWSIDATSILPQSARHGASITEVKKGGVLRIKNEVFVVQATATLTETDDAFKKMKDYVSTELVLFSLATGETRYLEWDRDDVVGVSFTERKLSKNDVSRSLKYDDGEFVDLDDFDEIIEEEEDLRFDGENYVYDDDWPALFVSSDGRTGKVYIAEFGDEMTGWLTIEAWWQEGTKDQWDYEVYLSFDLRHSDLEVISTGA